MVNKISPDIQAEIDKYFHLNIGNKQVVCPYYINTKVMAGNLRVMSGKGSAEEIELETKIWAKVKGFDLAKANENDIRKFMIDMKIGIDCSGFIANVLNNVLINSGNGNLVSKLNFADKSYKNLIRTWLRPIENIGANTLTSELNCSKITNLNEILPGDLIRAKGPQRNAHHIALIVETEFEDTKITRFKYVHSHRYYEDENGMRYGEVLITNSQGELKDQNWTDTLNGRNYMYEDLMVEYEDNGVRRLRHPVMSSV